MRAHHAFDSTSYHRVSFGTTARLAVAAAIAVAVYLIVASPPQPAGPDSAIARPQFVAEAIAAAETGAPIGSTGWPAPSSTATEGNVVDLTY